MPSASSTVVLLHEPNLLFEPRRLVRTLAERLSLARPEPLWPHRVLPNVLRLNSRESRPAMVHAVGKKALAAALTSSVPILFSPLTFPNAHDVRLLRAAIRYRRVRIICTTDAERRVWVTGGVPIDACVLIRPGVSMAMPADARTAARHRFGYSDADRVVFAPVPAVAKPRSTALWTGNLLSILDEQTKTLAWSDGGPIGTERLRSLRERLMVPHAMAVLTGDDPAEGFAAADAILLPPAAFVPPTLIAMSMASGKPIVAPATSQVCEMLEDRHTALLTAGQSPNEVAKRVIDVFTDRARARQIADRARAEAYEHFLLSRMVADYRTAYAGQAIDASTAARRSPLPVLSGQG